MLGAFRFERDSQEDQMPSFLSDGIEIAYEVFGDGRPILLIHGFASSGRINWVNTGWVNTGWVEALKAAGYQPIAIDNRGHGNSRKLYDPKLYYAHGMADDAARLLDHLGLSRVPVIGFSMGARIAAFLSLRHPGRVRCAIWGGMGFNLLTGMDDSEEIAAALTADSLADVQGATGRQFRLFADHSKADRAALAACVVTSREPMPRPTSGASKRRCWWRWAKTTRWQAASSRCSSCCRMARASSFPSATTCCPRAIRSSKRQR